MAEVDKSIIGKRCRITGGEYSGEAGKIMRGDLYGKGPSLVAVWVKLDSTRKTVRVASDHISRA